MEKSLNTINTAQNNSNQGGILKSFSSLHCLLLNTPHNAYTKPGFIRTTERGRISQQNPGSSAVGFHLYFFHWGNQFLGCAVTQAHWTSCLFYPSSQLLTLHTCKYRDICPHFPNHSNSTGSLIVLRGLERLGSAGKRSSSGDLKIAMISAQTNLSGFGSQFHSFHAGEILSELKK